MNSNEVREKAYSAIDDFLRGLQEGKYSCFADFPVGAHGQLEQVFNFAKDFIDTHNLVGYKHYDRTNPGGIVYLRDEGMNVIDLGGTRNFIGKSERNGGEEHSKMTVVKDLEEALSEPVYCIWHGYPFNGTGHNLGVEKSFVAKMARGYLRGENEVYISGKSYSVGSENFQIFEMPAQFADHEIVERVFYQDHSGNISERLFAKLFKRVTNDFIQDREWGALKEDLFNIHIFDVATNPILLLLKKAEVEEFLHSFAKGSAKIWVAGRTLTLISPTALKIFNISFEFLEKERGAVLKKMSKWAYENSQSKFDSKVLNRFGTDVTTDFEIKPFGMLKEKPLANIAEESSLSTSVSRIFISHSSKDLHVVRKFVDLILNNALGAVSSQIFCTSVEGLGIRSGADFKKEIKDELLRSDLVIQIISGNYKASEICLNEMGAAWVLSKEVIPFILDDNYDVGFIHASSQQLKLSKKADLLQFIEEKRASFPNISPFSKIDRHVDEFIKSIG